MIPQDVRKMGISTSEEDFPYYFHEWIKHRRQELDLTQEQLAKRASCSVYAIRKIEMGERRPSAQLARLLAKSLEIPTENIEKFTKVARGKLDTDCLRSLAPVIAPQPDGKRSLNAGNLPRSLTPFIGRELELDAIGELLQNPQCGLVTIVGPGGIGKTRLALEAAQQFKERFPDGIWFVSLAPLNSPALIVPAIAEALDFKLQVPTNPLAQLVRYLSAKKALLVLDNVEHLLDDVGIFAEILKDCPQIKLIATSRERLNMLSEWVFEIRGLPVPANDLAEKFDTFSSVALFVQSARRVQAGFELRPADRRDVLKICQFMEGIPLGIELSAAWVGLLSCEAIAHEISHNLDFLSVTMRDLPERHRSLRATLDHSWKLLSAEESKIFSRLSVFHGSFRRAAAEEICGANLAILSSLKNKSLLYRTDQDDYVLHEMIRQYAALKLAEDPDENERVKDRHAAYYVQLLSDWEQGLKSARQLEIFHEMAQMIENLSQGWQHLLSACRPSSGKGNQFCADLIHKALFSISLFYEMRCRSWEAIAIFTESTQYLKSLQGEFEQTEDRARFNSVLGHISAYLGLHFMYVLQYEKARAHLEEGVTLLEKSQSAVEKAQAHCMLGALNFRQGLNQIAASMYEQSREVFREAGERWWYLLSLINLSRSYLPLGRFEECEVIFQEAFRLVEPGDLRLELNLRNLYAYGRYMQNDFTLAEQLMQDNLQRCIQFENNRMVVYVYNQLGQVALSTSRVDLAEMYLGKAVNLISEFGETDEQAISLLYFGKCHLIRSEYEAAHEKFQQVIKIGYKLDTFYLVYWGLVNIASIYMEKGELAKALEIALVLRNCGIEDFRVQDEGDRLLADLLARLPAEQTEAAARQVDVHSTMDQASAAVLTYVREHEIY